MKQLRVKIMTMVLIAILVALIIPISVFAAEANMQVVKTENGDYIIYVEGVNTAFDFAISEKSDATDMELSYINSVEDDAEKPNPIALIKADQYASVNGKYIYIKTSEGSVVTTELNLDNAFDIKSMEYVEKTTKRIETEEVTGLEEKNEVINDVHITVKVGGLKITDTEPATYYYSRTKLSAENYDELKALADKINEEYNTEKMDMYTKIETAKQFYEKYEELVKIQNWTQVEEMTVRQPEDAQTGDQYIVFLRKVDENGKETTDVKFMTSQREEDKVDVQAASESVKETKRTSKLPVTGDSLILFVILAVIVLVAIIVFIRMKKLQGKESKH